MLGSSRSRETTMSGTSRLSLALVIILALGGVAHASDDICKDWKKLVDAGAQDFGALRGKALGKDGWGNRYASTIDFYDTKDCFIWAQKPGKSGRSDRVMHRCELEMQKSQTLRWERIITNFGHCARMRGEVFEDIPPDSSQERCGKKTCRQVRVAHGSDVGSLVTQIIETADAHNIIRLRFTVTRDHRRAHERPDFVQPLLKWTPPKGAPKAKRLAKVLTGRRASGDCLLLLLGRKGADAPVKAVLDALGPRGEVVDKEGRKRLIFKKHGFLLLLDKAGERVDILWFKVGDIKGIETMKKFRGQLPYGISQKDSYGELRRRLGLWHTVGNRSVHVTDRAWMSFDTEDRKLTYVSFQLRKGWDPYPLTGACGF